jgi:hypothetical protein
MMQLCDRRGCGRAATILWQRRATADEWAANVAEWRQHAHDLAERFQQNLPKDVLVPEDGHALRTVASCDQHAPANPAEVQP